MIKKLTKVSLVIVLLSNNILGTANLVSAMGNTGETDVVHEANVTVEAEDNAAAITTEAEENSTDVPIDSNSIDANKENSTVVPEVSSKSDTTEENSTDASAESTISDTVKNNEPESQTSEETRYMIDATQIISSSSTGVVEVSNAESLKDAVKIDGTKIKLTQNITLEEPLVVSGSDVVIDGDNKKLELHEGSNNNQNGFVIKPVIKDTKVKNVELRNITFENYSLNAISLLNAENVLIENVTFKGKSNSNITKSNVGIDLDNSTATIKNIVSMNHAYAGIRVRNASQLNLSGWNEHTSDKKDLQLVSGTVTDENNNYTAAWNNDSTYYKVKTKRKVNDLTEFENAIAIENTSIELSNNIEINKSIEIKSKSITIDGKNPDGDNYQLIVKSNSPTDDSKNTSSLAVKSANAVLENLTIINDTTNKPGLTLYGTTNPKLTNIKIEGIDPNNNNDRRSGVALDIYKTEDAILKNITCSNSLYRDFQVRGGSQVEILSQNVHSTGAVHIQSIQKAGETENIIKDVSNFYNAGVAFEEKGETKVDYFLKIEKEATTIKDILDNIKTGGTVVKLQNDIKLDWDDLPEDDPESLIIEVSRNVTIDGNGHTLDLDSLGSFVIKGKDVIVKNITIDNSYEHGVNIYNSQNTLLDKVVVSNSLLNGIFVNGSTVVLRDVSTLNSVDEGIKITRSRTLNSPSHFDSEVKVEGTLTQKESNVSVNILNLEMLDGAKQNNKFIPQEGTYIDHINDANYKKLSQYYIDLFGIQGTPAAEKEYWEQEHDYMVLQEKLDVTNQQTVLDEHGQPIQLIGDGVTDNTDNLIKLIEYAGTHSQTLYFPAGTYKITKDIDLSKINLPATSTSNFKLLGDEDGLAIVDGSSNVDKMLEIFNGKYHSPMNYVDIEHLVFNNVGVAINGPYKKGITLKNNVFMNGNYTREKRADGSVSKATMEPYIEVKNSKYVIENNMFLRGEQYPGRGIATYRSKNTTIKNNFFGSLDGIDDAVQMIPEIASKLSMIKESNLVDGDQGNFFTAINNERYDTNVLIQNNYFNLMKTRNVVSDFASDTLISGINVAADGQRRDHIIYSKGYDNLQIVGNYFKGQENGAAGGVKIRNGKNAYVGANYFDDVPLLTYIYPDLTKAETLLHNTVIYNNLFHQKTNFGMQGTGILFYQSFRDGDDLTFKDGEVWDDSYGDVQDFVIYQNEFKSDDRDRITITGRAEKAYKDNQFLAYDNKYKNKDQLVNYNTQGNFGLKESTVNEILGKVANNSGYTQFNSVKIPLTPAKVDYTYVNTIYDEAKAFYDQIVNDKLIADMVGYFDPAIAEELKELLYEVKELEQNNATQWVVNEKYTQILETLERLKETEDKGFEDVPTVRPDDVLVDTNTSNDGDYVGDDEMGVNPDEDQVVDDKPTTLPDDVPVEDDKTSDDTKPEDKPESDKPDTGGNDNVTGPGNGTGSGNGSGSGNGTGTGSGGGNTPEDGDGSGDENTPGDGNGSGDGNTPGDGDGSGDGNTPGDGNGSGDGNTPGDGNGLGDGDNSENGNGSGSGDNSGDGNNSGSEKEESVDTGTVDKPTVDEQEKLDSLPQTGEVFNRVLTALGVLLIIAAGVLLMKRSKTE